MASNLGTDRCLTCNYRFDIEDFVGKTVEFRQVGDYTPQLGCKLVCGCCGTVYFGWIRQGHNFFGYTQEAMRRAFEDRIPGIGSDKLRKNYHKGKFVKKVPDLQGKERLVDLGYYQIDLAYYETYRDEGRGVECDEPRYLCTKSHALTRLDY